MERKDKPKNAIAEYFRDTHYFWYAIGLAIVICFIFYIMFLLLHTLNKNNYYVLIILIGTACICLILTSFWMVYKLSIEMLSANENLGLRRNVIRVAHLYTAVIMTFAALYLCSVLSIDLYDAYSKNDYYFKNINSVEISRPKDKRAFKELGSSMWSCAVNPTKEMLESLKIESGIYNFDEDGQMTNPTLQITQTILKKDHGRRCYFIRENIWTTIGNCIYFSVITITTVGYGDISPSHWVTKILSCIEALAGTLLFAFSINYLFSQDKIKSDN